MVKISVIVPVYKTAKYLRKCIDSVKNQTFSDIEIILVSDGPDEEHQICDEYAKKDSRIKVLKDIKKGLGGARNAGMEIAKGEYIAFVDSDDWIEKDYCEKMYSAIIENGEIDIVQCGTKIVFEGEIDYTLKTNDENYFGINDSGAKDLVNDYFGKVNVGTWNKLYKKDLINKYNIRFPENMCNEDAYFTWAYFSVCNKIYFIPDQLYNYLRRQGSLMALTFNKGLGEKVIHHLIVGEMLYDFFIKNGLWEKRETAFWNALLICYWFVYENADKKNFRIGYNRLRKFLRNKQIPISYQELIKIKNKAYSISNMSKFAKFFQIIFSLKNNDHHKILTILGLKIKFKKDNNNSIIIVENNKERLLKNKEVIKGLAIRFEGKNNTVKIHKPYIFNDCFFDIKSDNSYIEINTPRWGINNVYLITVCGNNQRFIVEKDVFISGLKCFLSEESAEVLIKESSMLSMDIVIFPTDCHPIFDIESKKRINSIKKPSVVIGKHCWIGMGVFIGKNVHLSDDIIVGMRSVVTKSFDESHIAIGGVPAKIVKRNVTWHHSLDQKICPDILEDQSDLIQKENLGLEVKRG